MNQNNRIGEVVESSSLQFTVQCYDLYKSPNIGTLVKCGTNPQLFGIVYDVSNKSMDPARRPVPRGRDAFGLPARGIASGCSEIC